MWPCGIVVLMQELFTAESKSQVYAALHELLSNYPSISQSLSMCCVLCNRAHSHSCQVYETRDRDNVQYKIARAKNLLTTPIFG